MAPPKLNIVFFTGQTSYPAGMAGTKRIQHAIDALKVHEDVAVRVIIPRQSSEENPPSGTHEGIPYETVMPDLMRAKMALGAPALWFNTMRALKRAWRPGFKNIIYKYGPPSIDDTFPIWHARRKGYLVVYDIVEDDEVAAHISSSLYHRINNRFYRLATKGITRLADGIVIISSHLEAKFRNLTGEKIPLHFRPISVDLDKFPQAAGARDKQVDLFYAGSFGVKDGVENLIDAFNILASSHAHLRLVLTGKGSPERMRAVLGKIESSPVRERIDHRGYLDENDYYATLCAADIPCVTRVDTGFANAGFPFKLGEYLATGKPVVASRVSDVGSLLTHRRDAMLVKPGDSKEIAAAVEHLMENPEEAAAIGKRGRDLAKSLFDYRTQGQALIDFLRGL